MLRAVDLDDWVNALNRAVELARSHHKNVRSDCEGWMMKRGGRWKSWKKRFFALYGDELCYFKTAEAQRDIGKINLKKALDVQFDCQKDCPDGWIPFRIFSMDRTWLLCCETQEEIDMWRDAIIKKGKIRHRHVSRKRPDSTKLNRPKSVAYLKGGLNAPPPPPPSDDEDDDGEFSDELSTPPDTPPHTPPASEDEGSSGDGEERGVAAPVVNKLLNQSHLISEGRRRSSSAPSLSEALANEQKKSKLKRTKSVEALHARRHGDILLPQR